jgi:hypothetical protein
VLRPGAAAVTGALGAYALTGRFQRAPLTAPVTMTGTGVPLAPRLGADPAPAGRGPYGDASSPCRAARAVKHQS